MDDTLLNDDKKISAENAAAIRQATRAGILVLLATGRMYESVLPYALQLHMNVPLICYNGALVKGSTDKKILFERTMDSKISQSIFQFGREIGLHMQGYWNGQVYTDYLNDSSRWYSKMINIPVQPIGSKLYTEPHQTYKILGMAEPDAFISQWQALQKKFQGQTEITTSIKNFLEILIPGIDKWSAIANLAAESKISQEEIMCIGDSLNDLSMITNAGTGVAMGNANPEVQKHATWTVADNNHNGVAEAIKKALN